ncbi:Rad52/Rad22 family DNA repair protein [Kosakonia sp. YIM B13605]|uniref:Rad52/Rad22 family DNA repair protein n=1 Tax=unclassified Kosakonia TaxID=2632876 RepID=UPI0036CFE391
MELDRLDDPFTTDDIEWRIQQAGKNNNGIWAKVLAYVTNRAIMKRLDDVCGKAGWRNEYRDIPNNGGVECGISIKVDGEWITKWDAAEQTQVEAVKGGRSGAMKRAAVQWGIGRYLYNLEEGFATVSPDRKPGFIYARSKDVGAFYWLPPSLPSWALPKSEEPNATNQSNKHAGLSTEEADAILSEFSNYASSENNAEALTEKYKSTWEKLAGFDDHQSRCVDVTSIRRKELKQSQPE